jgi:ATP-dependent DNA ligase
MDVLYKKIQSGKIKSWSINVINNNNTVIVRIISGIVDGKMVTFDSEITQGKNIGRTNETSLLEQGENDAKSKFNKKLDQGYTLNKNGESSCNIILPMLAQNYDKFHNKIVYPAFYQPKLDGVRAIYQNNLLYSRGRKKFPHLEHILKDLKGTSYILDGELYSDNLTFQEINGIVRKVTLNRKDIELSKNIQYRVYDIVSPLNFEKRLDLLNKIFKDNNFNYVFMVDTNILNSNEQVKNIHDNFVRQGYEGMIIRNKLGKYDEDARSNNLQKVKIFDDAEFEIIDFRDGTGKESGAIIWQLATEYGKVFNARPIGTIEERKKMYKNGHKYIGKRMNVKYFGLTDTGIPRFPIAQYIRDLNY